MLEVPDPERGTADLDQIDRLDLDGWRHQNQREARLTLDQIDRLDLEWMLASVQSPCEKYAGWGGRGRLLIWGVISLSSQAAGSLNRTQLDDFSPCLSSVASVVTGPMNSGVLVTVG